MTTSPFVLYPVGMMTDSKAPIRQTGRQCYKSALILSYKPLSNKEGCVLEILQQRVVIPSTCGLCQTGIPLHKLPALQDTALQACTWHQMPISNFNAYLFLCASAVPMQQQQKGDLRQ